jgi:hypothetical protein
MNLNTRLTIAVAAGILLLAVALHYGRGLIHIPESIVRAGGHEITMKHRDGTVDHASDNISLRATSRVANPIPIDQLNALDKRSQKTELWVKSKNVPIEFWGRVVDQDDHPLADVQVQYHVRQWFYVPPLKVDAHFPERSVLTDASGAFQMLDNLGDVLTIRTLVKAGYEPEPNALRSFGYNISDNIKPDANRPVVFKMWQTNAKQAALVTGNKFFTIIPDGRYYTLDLLNGTLLDGETAGDLRLRLNRSPNASWGKRYDWSFELKAVNGGILPESNRDASMYLAPESGYNTNYQFAFGAPDDTWSYLVERRFYLTSREGMHYARMDVEIHAFYLKDNQARFAIKYAVNPTGGRVLR